MEEGPECRALVSQGLGRFIFSHRGTSSFKVTKHQVRRARGWGGRGEQFLALGTPGAGSSHGGASSGTCVSGGTKSQPRCALVAASDPWDAGRPTPGASQGFPGSAEKKASWKPDDALDTATQGRTRTCQVPPLGSARTENRVTAGVRAWRLTRARSRAPGVAAQSCPHVRERRGAEGRRRRAEEHTAPLQVRVCQALESTSSCWRKFRRTEQDIYGK